MHEFVVDTAFGRIAGLRAQAAATKPRVLALHGWLDNAASFEPLASRLDVQLVAPDLPGHGASAHLPPAAEYSSITAARAAFAVADALGWDRFALLGHSLGGAVATAMAAAAPQRITRLVTIEALGVLVEDESRTAQRLRESFAAQARAAGTGLRVFGDVATAVRARVQANGLTEAAAMLLVERGIAPVDGGFVWRSDPRLTRPTAVRMTEAQVRDLVAAIECPTRVIYAEPAPAYFPEPLRAARAALLRRGDVVRIVGSHHLHMEDVDAVAAAIGGFFHAPDATH